MIRFLHYLAEPVLAGAPTTLEEVDPAVVMMVVVVAEEAEEVVVYLCCGVANKH